VTYSNEREQKRKAVVTPDDNIIIVDIIVKRDARGGHLIVTPEFVSGIHAGEYRYSWRLVAPVVIATR
jgi:hypothetical protein